MQTIPEHPEVSWSGASSSVGTHSSIPHYALIPNGGRDADSGSRRCRHRHGGSHREWPPYDVHPTSSRRVRPSSKKRSRASYAVASRRRDGGASIDALPFGSRSGRLFPSAISSPSSRARRVRIVAQDGSPVTPDETIGASVEGLASWPAATPQPSARWSASQRDRGSSLHHRRAGRSTRR